MTVFEVDPKLLKQKSEVNLRAFVGVICKHFHFAVTKSFMQFYDISLTKYKYVYKERNQHNNSSIYKLSRNIILLFKISNLFDGLKFLILKL